MICNPRQSQQIFKEDADNAADAVFHMERAQIMILDFWDGVYLLRGHQAINL